MIENIHSNIIGLVIGIRYRANFSIEDSLGEIVDKILYSKNSYFNPKAFALVKNKINEKILHDESGINKLIINNSNIILDIHFNEYFKQSDYEEIIKRFNTEVIEGVLKKYKISEINRMGIVNRYLFPNEHLAKKFVEKTIGGTLEGVNDINLTFSKKFPTTEALVKKDVLDYRNVIFNVIKQSDSDELFVSVDFQKFFDPFVSVASDLGFLEFATDVRKFNNKNYLNWLNKNYLD